VFTALRTFFDSLLVEVSRQYRKLTGIARKKGRETEVLDVTAAFNGYVTGATLTSDWLLAQCFAAQLSDLPTAAHRIRLLRGHCR
jgi:hypothetical protein